MGNKIKNKIRMLKLKRKLSKISKIKKKSDYLTNYNRQLIEYIEDYRKMNQLLEEKMKRSEENGKQNKK